MSWLRIHDAANRLALRVETLASLINAGDIPYRDTPFGREVEIRDTAPLPEGLINTPEARLEWAIRDQSRMRGIVEAQEIIFESVMSKLDATEEKRKRAEKSAMLLSFACLAIAVLGVLAYIMNNANNRVRLEQARAEHARQYKAIAQQFEGTSSKLLLTLDTLRKDKTALMTNSQHSADARKQANALAKQELEQQLMEQATRLRNEHTEALQTLRAEIQTKTAAKLAEARSEIKMLHEKIHTMEAESRKTEELHLAERSGLESMVKTLQAEIQNLQNR